MLSKIHLSACKGCGLGREKRRNGLQNILVAAKLYVVNSRSARCKEPHTAYVHWGQLPRLLYCNIPNDPIS